ncbi:hypothetical protein B0A48_04254 [Cryoendolithus antarcticus]|uniref:Uncharacterized protein n=1 Tax=Cryoendolithus antarcticus TaxID=1507870 RepID=A0A1V8TEU8_9PEZI|nr:hypothetical protein B0A48_04254 [Cryoendolithus antarcticus]
MDLQQQTTADDEAVEIIDARPKSRPSTARSSTDPSPSAILQDYFSSLPAGRPVSSHRNRSPYSRSHLRSRSSGSTLQAPLMTRAHSLPSVHAASRACETSTSSSGSLSPAPRSPARVRSPFKEQQQDVYLPPPRSPSWYEGTTPSSGGGIESIHEDMELDLTPRAQQPLPSPSTIAGASFSRSGSLRRRPVSPLLNAANTSASSFPASVIDQNVPIHHLTTSSSSSPSLGATKFNESFPSGLSLHHYASNSSFSSLSSTPSSMRSRSPSISSLDTIEDAPDAESEAVEEERKRIAERDESGEESGEEEGRRRKSLDSKGAGFGFGRGSVAREKKRWSICGGERRGDLDLETIWED